MTTRTRMNVYFDPILLKQVEALALRRNISKSAIVEAAVASFLSGDTLQENRTRERSVLPYLEARKSFRSDDKWS